MLLPLLIGKAPATPPNIVVLYMDDAGYGDFGFTGHPVIRTPNIDRMAQEGCVATHYYSVTPVCTASRYALLTGRYPSRSGFAEVLSPDSPRYLHPKERTLADSLKAKGYATGMVGKWHLGFPNTKNGMTAAAMPLAHGFDEYLGLPYSNDMIPPKYPPLPLIASDPHGTSPVAGYRTVEMDNSGFGYTQRYTRRAVDFIGRHAKKPFFLYLAYAMPHVPESGGPGFAGRSPRGKYGDAIEEIDWSVGQILGALRAKGLAKNTFVMLSSDNGPWRIKGLDAGSAGLFRDGKWSDWEGGTHLPFVAWGANVRPNSRIAQPIASIDLFPTFAKWCGLPAPAGADGRELTALFAGRPQPDQTIGMYGPGNRLFALRRGRWKLHLDTTSEIDKHPFNDPLPLLFDVEADPSETKNVAAEHPDVVRVLQAEAAKLPQVADHASFWDKS